MKIGILTYHSIFNFGANLQAYSTYKYLENNGFDPVVIDYVPRELEEGYKKSHLPEQIAAHTDFINYNIKLTEKCRNTSDVAKTIEENNIKAVLIGSDAVLQHKSLLARMYLTKRGIRFKPKRSNVIFPNPFWGSFIDELKEKIPVSVMSASSQNMNFKIIKGAVKKNIGKALLQFNDITVRDDWTRKMISYFTLGKVKPEITPDPVFAFNQNVKQQPTKEEILAKFNLPEKYILFSFKHHNKVDESWLASFNDLLKPTDYKPVYLTAPGGVIFDNVPFKAIAPPLSPIDWYALIKYSSGYIGENMHPIIVALHNAVPFFCFDSYGIVKYKYQVNEKSSKIYHILKKAGFENNRTTTLGKKYSFPDVSMILKSVEKFDRAKCMKFSENQLIDYNRMMKSLTNNLVL